MPLISTVLAPDRNGIGITGPKLGSGIGGAGGIRFGGWVWACGRPMAKSRMRTAGRAGKGIAEKGIEISCSADVSAPNTAPVVARAPSASLTAFSASTRLPACIFMAPGTSPTGVEPIWLRSIELVAPCWPKPSPVWVQTSSGLGPPAGD
jgi:hypothetical protein